MINSFHECVDGLEEIFYVLEKKIARPRPVQYASSFVYRYNENILEVALIQKLARTITGLRAAIVLLQSGFFQELAVLQRVLDDIDEEILFLVYGKLMGTWGAKHEKFLQGFFAETFADPSNPSTALDIKRPIVPRKDIRECIDQSMDVMKEQGEKIDINMSEASQIVSKVFNGFIHAGSPQILDMYGGNPPHYHLNGMLGTPRVKENIGSLWNQFFRGSLAFVLVSIFFQDDDLSQKAQLIHDNFKKS